MTQTKDIPTITFTSTVETVGNTAIVRLPEAASLQLPSRGQVSVKGMLNGDDFRMVLEPDGRWGHWFRVPKDLGLKVGDTVALEIAASKTWPEPDVPKDFKKALETASEKVKTKWHDITPMARWEWIRWVNSTGNTDTRAVRIEKSISKLDGKHRRPCCFNLAACTDPELSKSGRLLEA